jgi:hypothetical protein
MLLLIFSLLSPLKSEFVMQFKSDGCSGIILCGAIQDLYTDHDAYYFAGESALLSAKFGEAASSLAIYLDLRPRDAFAHGNIAIALHKYEFEQQPWLCCSILKFL